MGCIMMRKCHLNTCPVGIATQDPVLRQKFQGMPEHVANYLMFVAEEARQLMANLGFRTRDELIGCSDCLQVDPNINENNACLSYLPIIMPAHQLPDAGKIGKVERHKTWPQENLSHLAIDLSKVLDRQLVEEAAACFRKGERVSIKFNDLINMHRSTGTLLSGELYRRWGNSLQPGTCHVKLEGTSGQSFGAFSVKGLFLELEGDSQDYFGKGLSGGTLALYPPRSAMAKGFVAEDNIVAGNACLIGAINGLALVISSLKELQGSLLVPFQ
jgi:hypothetical protein